MSERLILKDAHNVSMHWISTRRTLQRLLLASAASWLLHVWLMQWISPIPSAKIKAMPPSLITRQIAASTAPTAPTAPEPPVNSPKQPKPAQNPAFSISKKAKTTVETAEEAPQFIANDLPQNQMQTQSESAQRAAQQVAQPDVAPASLASPAAQEPEQQLLLPAATQLHYEFEQKRRGVPTLGTPGSSILSWKHDGQRYELSWQTKNAQALLLQQSSVGRISSTGLSPIRFSDRRAARSERAAHFRPELARIQFSNNRPDAPLSAGAQDALSAWIQLSALLAGDARLAQSGQRLRMNVANTDSLQSWEWEIKGVERIQIGEQAMDALRVEQLMRGEYDWPWSLWLAPGLHYLPVQMLQRSALAPDQDFSLWRLQKIPEAAP